MIILLSGTPKRDSMQVDCLLLGSHQLGHKSLQDRLHRKAKQDIGVYEGNFAPLCALKLLGYNM